MSRDGVINPKGGPVLRLVHSEHGPRPTGLRRANTPGGSAEATAAVTSENNAAAELDPTDGRWVFAVRVARSIEGGRAAVLRPEVRERLVIQAETLGLRPFDANLVIAVVQDAARTGAHALDASVESRLRLIREPSHRRPVAVWPLVVSAALLGIAILTMLVNWIVLS